MSLQPYLVVLILVAALTHAAWNALLKMSGERFLTFSVILGTGTVLGVLVAPFVDPPAPAAWPYLALSALVHNVYYVFLLLCYRFGDLSHVYPLARGSAPLFVAVLAAVLADEVPGPWGIAAIGLVSLGIVGLTLGGGTLHRPAARAVAVALMTGILIASYTVVDGLGLRRAGAPWGYIVWLNVLEGLPVLAVVLVCRRRDMGTYLAHRWRPAISGGVLAIVAYGLVLYALGQGAMGYVAALRETSILFAAVIGALSLKESFGRRRIAAAAVIVTGIVVLQAAG